MFLGLGMCGEVYLVLLFFQYCDRSGHAMDIVVLHMCSIVGGRVGDGMWEL